MTATESCIKIDHSSEMGGTQPHSRVYWIALKAKMGLANIKGTERKAKDVKSTIPHHRW